MKLCWERYEELKNEVVTLFEQYNISCTPVNGFEIAARMGIRMRAYSTYAAENKKILLRNFPDGCSCQKEGISYIFYNDYTYYPRQNWTIMHEIAHLYLGHSEQSKIAEMEANFFAKFALVPPVLIQRCHLSSEAEIMERFHVSRKAASFALEHCRKWYDRPRQLTMAERKLCSLFRVAV